MRPTPPEVALAYFVSILFWLLLVGAFFLAARRWTGARSFRDKMLAQRNPAFAIALIYLVAGVIGSKLELGRTLGSALGSIQIFCQALIGLAIARSIPSFEPLPVSQAVIRRERPWRSVILMLLIGTLAGAVGIVVGSIGQGVLMSITHETSHTGEAIAMLPTDKWLSFFSLLAGAGIAEETLYRLVALSFVWRLTGRRGWAILIAALLFAAYHFTPLDGMYTVFLQYPISHFVATVLIGTLWGFVYSRRGYETAVLGHTMSDWLAIMIFAS